MSQNSLVLPTTGTVSGLQMTQNTNQALDTLNTLASGASAPASAEAGQLWHDTTNNLLWIRSLDNTTWIPFLQLNESAYASLPYLSTPIMGNRLINSGMSIDQVNEGSAYSLTTATPAYTLDQWELELTSSSASGVTAQRVTDAPVGFTNSLKVTVGTGAGSVASGDFLFVNQPIEANNVSDLGYGASGAAPVSVSFWVKSSVAGTFAATLANASFNRSIVIPFTISSTGTWQKITIPNIPGDIAGTWGSGNGIGLVLYVTAAAGTSYQTSTLNSWQGLFYLGSTTQTNGILTTSGATFQLTGVMLNSGVFCLPYEKRNITSELQLCQRYYAKTFPAGTAVAQNAGIAGSLWFPQSAAASTGDYSTLWQLPVLMRAAPTTTVYNPSASNAQIRDVSITADWGSTAVAQVSANGVLLNGVTPSGSAAGHASAIQITANARM